MALTRAGAALVPALAALADANDEHFFGHLADQERFTLDGVLRDLVQRHQMTDIPVA